MRTTYYTKKQWNTLSVEEQLSFGAGNVELVSFQRNGRWVSEWKVTRIVK